MLVHFHFCIAQEIEADTLKRNQSDTTLLPNRQQVIPIESYAKKYDPRKALLYSAVFPGSGQIYNKKYWKAPLVYGGFGVLTYIAYAYHNLYTKYRNEYFILLNDGSSGLSPSGYSKDQLTNIINKTRRERDFFIILNGFWYILQMVDAHVDAHLKEFDLNPKLQVSIEPEIRNSMFAGTTTGVSLIIKF
jgi:hypothetical protein